MSILRFILRRSEQFLSFKKFRQKLSDVGYRLWITHGSRIFKSYFYGDWFYKACSSNNAKSHPVIAKALVTSLDPYYVVDFGCGDGLLLSEFAKHHVDGIGYEFSNASINRCRRRGVSVVKLDFSNHILPSPLPKGDLLVCLEVAEHLPIKDADFLCDLLSCCRDSKWLVFSAAIPGQGGEGHLNEQPHNYWRDKIEARGWRYEDVLTKQQKVYWCSGGVVFYYWQNLQIFERNMVNK